MDFSTGRIISPGVFYKVFGSDEPFWVVRHDNCFILGVQGPCCLCQYEHVNGSTVVHYGIIRGGYKIRLSEPLETLLRLGVFMNEPDATAYEKQLSSGEEYFSRL